MQVLAPFRSCAASKPGVLSAARLEQARIEGERFYRGGGDARRRVVIVIDQDVHVRGLIDRNNGGRNAQRLLPPIAALLCPAFLMTPVSGQINQGKSLNGKIVGHVVTHHHQSRQKRWILDVDQLLQNAKSRGRAAVRNGMSHRIPAPIEKKAVATIECPCMCHS